MYCPETPTIDAPANTLIPALISIEYFFNTLNSNRVGIRFCAKKIESACAAVAFCPHCFAFRPSLAILLNEINNKQCWCSATCEIRHLEFVMTLDECGNHVLPSRFGRYVLW